jgi:hypothetical protein
MAIGIHPPLLATELADAPEVVLTFAAQLVAGNAVDIQTGAHAGGPATVFGDAITLDATGAAFEANGKIRVAWNGQLLEKGSMLGSKEAQWISATQLAFSFNVLPGNQVSIQTV